MYTKIKYYLYLWIKRSFYSDHFGVIFIKIEPKFVKIA